MDALTTSTRGRGRGAIKGRWAAALLAALLPAGCTDCSERGERAHQIDAQAPSRVESLPYLNWNPLRPEDRDRVGVTRHDPERAFAGLNLYNSRPRAEARLIDMKGKVVHRWATKVGQPTAAEREWTRMWPHMDLAGWEHVELRPGGGLYVLIRHHRVLKLDWRSRVVWETDLAAHHDLAFADSGAIYVLAANKISLRHRGQRMVVLDTELVTLTPRGRVKRRLSLRRALERSPRTRPHLVRRLETIAPAFKSGFARHRAVASRLQSPGNLKRTVRAVRQILAGEFPGSRRLEYMMMNSLNDTDLLHANGLDVLREDAAGLGRKGDLLVSIRELDLVVVLEPRSGQVRWAFGPGVIERQHQPSVLPNGHVLLFDNGPSRRHSRVVEVDPRSREIVWSYQADPPEQFFSSIRGGVQRLPNGNVLITDSERGRVFEITRAGDVVWEFFNPDLDDPYAARKRAPIYRMTRLSRDAVQPPDEGD